MDGSDFQEITESLPVMKPAPVRLTKTKGTAIWHDIVLEDGDVIVSVNGVFWPDLPSILESINDVLENKKEPVLIGISRRGKVFFVFSETGIDCATEEVAEEEFGNFDSNGIDLSAYRSGSLSQFVIFSDGLNSADVLEVRSSFLAMTFPLLWLISKRLWGACVSAFCLVLTAFVLNPWFGVFSYIFLCIFVGKKHLQIFRVSLSRSGMRRFMVLAARDEVTAQDTALIFNEKLKFRFPKVGNQSSKDASAKKLRRRFTI